MTEPTPLEKYLRSVEDFATPEQFRQLLRELGSVEKELARREALGDTKTILARNAALDEIREERRSTRWVGKRIKEAALWFSAVGAALSLAFGAYLTAASVLRALEPQPPAQVEQDSQP